MKKIILASTSPRRKEIFQKTGLKFQVASSRYEEDMTARKNPKALAKFLSLGKAQSVVGRFKNAIIISADSFVVLNNKFLGKPKSKAEAAKMLRKVSGKTLLIITGYSIIDTSSGKKESKAVETKLYLKKLSEKTIQNYIKTGEPLDKAGAFAIQGIGATLIKRIEGDFLGAMGLPLYELSISLKKFGIEIL